MNAINERVAKLRSELKLNQTEFGKAIGLSTSGISSIENGTRKVTDQHIRLLCSELNVDEKWLRTGKGDMFTENDTTILAELASEYHLDAIDKMIIEHYLKLDTKDRQLIKERVVALAEDITALNETVATTEEATLIGSDLKLDAEIEAELESYRRELEAQKKIRTSSVLRVHDAPS